MNITEAKQIPLKQLAEALGGYYSHTDRKGDLWYHSPFRPDEKTASFKINEKKNTWHDFGLANTGIHRNQGGGGDIIDLWCDYHFKDRRLGVKEALAGLRSLGLFAIGGERLHLETVKEKPSVQNQQPTLKILKIAERITHFGLKDELQRRKISFELAHQYLKQGHILDTVTKKEYYGFLFENDKGGFEVSIPNPHRGECFKTSIGPKASRYLAPDRQTSAVDVFEGFWDFLSWLEIKKVRNPLQHAFVLNSNSFAGEVCEKIIHMQDELNYVFLFLDNDVSGYKTTHAIALELEPHGFQTASMDGFYKSYKDVNAYLCKKPIV